MNGKSSVNRSTITINGKGINKEEWTKDAIDGILREMANKTKADLDRLYSITDEEAEDMATD